MNNTKELNIGDKVWWAVCKSEQVKNECIVCFGKREITILLGNGEQVKTECEYCKNGFENARGFTMDYKRTSDIKEIIITGKEVVENEKGRKIEYRYQNYCLYFNDNIFIVKEDAENRLVEMIKEYEQEEVKRIIERKKSITNHLSWSIGYYKKELKNAQNKVDYYLRKITELKNEN